MPAPVESSQTVATEADGRAVELEHRVASRDGGASVFTLTCTTTPDPDPSLDRLRTRVVSAPGAELLADREVDGAGWHGWRARQRLTRAADRFDADVLLILAGSGASCQLQVITDPRVSTVTTADRERFLGSVKVGGG